MNGSGRAFDDLDDTGELSQLTVIKAEDGYVYITIVGPDAACRFVAPNAQADLIAKAIVEAMK